MKNGDLELHPEGDWVWVDRLQIRAMRILQALAIAAIGAIVLVGWISQ